MDFSTFFFFEESRFDKNSDFPPRSRTHGDIPEYVSDHDRKIRAKKMSSLQVSYRNWYNSFYIIYATGVHDIARNVRTSNDIL